MNRQASLPSPRNALEKNFFSFVNGPDWAKGDGWTLVFSALQTILLRHSKWTMEEPILWGKKFRRDFFVSSKVVTDLIVQDLESSDDGSFLKERGPGLLLALDGNRPLPPPLFDQNNHIHGDVKHTALSAAAQIRDGWQAGYYAQGFTVLDQCHSLLSYVPSESTSNKILELISPQWNRNNIREWLTLPGTEAPEFRVTMTHSGQITEPCDIGPGLDTIFYHVFGYKLFLIWEGSPINYQIIRRRQVYYHLLDLDWCLENLEGLKVCPHKVLTSR
jgi:hypothetical protein